MADPAASTSPAQWPGRKGRDAATVEPQEVRQRPPARKAQLKRRHWGLMVSLVVVVLLPVALTAFYLVTFARDQHASTTGFTVRREETGSASELLGGLSQIVGSGGGDADMLYEYIHSQEIVERVHARLDLIAHYTAGWPRDPVFSIWPTATIEDLLSFWQRMVRVTYDRNTGLIMVQVRAHDPDTAQTIARLIVAESEAMINTLNETARSDTMRYAQEDLDEALERLRRAREALAEFRARTQIVDPQADIQGRMGVLNNLQQQLAQALIDHDLLLQSVDAGDPRVRQAMRRIEVIQERIREERINFSAQNVTVDETDYPRLLAQYESLRVDQEFAERTYQAALTALDAARSNASRQGLYLATFVRPTLAQRSEYPRRLVLIGLTALFSAMLWGVLALVYYSLRDRG